MPLFAVRARNDRCGLLFISDTDDVVFEPICEVCKRQGIIWHAHPDDEEHKGSPHFRPIEWTPETLREFADVLERKRAAS